MKVPLNPCYILHQRAYRETSLILEVFSREHGRLSLVAKGAKRGKAGIRNLMQVTHRLAVAWSIRSQMGTLTAIEPDGPTCNLRGRWLIAAFYLNELLMRMLHRHESHPELFDAYHTALTRLAGQEAEQATLRIFEKNLLRSLGYGLILDHDVASGKLIDNDRDYNYQLDYGPMTTVPSVAEHVKISGRTLNALSEETLEDEDSLQEAKLLLRFTLKRHLGTKPLASRVLYQSYLKTL
ncbi:MAG: DNA repair protein RecO [Gammaproteobacteria bacterium]